MEPEDLADDSPERAIVTRATKWASQVLATASDVDRRQRRADGVATVLTVAAGRVEWLSAAEAWLRIEVDLNPGRVRDEALQLVLAALAAAKVLDGG